jgi:hypothetical protein
MADVDTENSQIIQYEKMKKIGEEELARSLFKIAGQVVDARGQIVKDVLMEVTFSRSSAPFKPNEQLQKKEIIDGKFFITKTRYTYLHITFSKPGYYPVKMSFSVNEPPNNPSSPIQDNLKIRLRKIGNIAKLKVLNRSIEWSEAGNSIIILLPELKRVRKNQVSPQKFFEVWVGRNNNDNIILADSPVQPWGRTVPSQVCLELISKTKEDGIIIAHDVSDFGDMTEAPACGYSQRKIPLTVSHVFQGYIFFYYRIGDIYGKGRVEKNVSTTMSSNLLTVSLFLMQNDESQPSKKRNLTSANTGNYGSINN